jgi:Metallo-beta-lactamase superfamily
MQAGKDEKYGSKSKMKAIFCCFNFDMGNVGSMNKEDLPARTQVGGEENPMILYGRSLRILLISAVYFLILLIYKPVIAQTEGETLLLWSSGMLDIHHINTGRGEAAFLIFPDGTTMLIDAGSAPGTSPRSIPQRPDNTRSPGEWIATYIRNILSHDSELKIDYALLTHFHSDHMGAPTEDSKKSADGDYLLTGITEVGESIKIRKIIDRGWPDYNFPLPVENRMVNNYRKFLEWQVENNGLQVERFKAGRSDQISPVQEPKKYPKFMIRNIAVNGEIWTGNDTETYNYIPPVGEIKSEDWEDWPNENMFSTVLRLSYGNFDYYTGGDIPGYPWPGAPAWGDLETPVANAVGEVDVHVLNHHGFVDAANEFFIKTLKPRVNIVQVLGASHLCASAFRRLTSRKLYPGPRDIFTTNLHEAKKIILGSSAEDAIKSSRGHILVRVAPGGDFYKVIILDDLVVES